MILFPAIDLKEGKVVRLLYGDLDAVTVYGENPGAQAQAFAEAGCDWLHVVDLNGAVVIADADAIKRREEARGHRQYEGPQSAKDERHGLRHATPRELHAGGTLSLPVHLRRQNRDHGEASHDDGKLNQRAATGAAFGVIPSQSRVCRSRLENTSYI